MLTQQQNKIHRVYVSYVPHYNTSMNTIGSLQRNSTPAGACSPFLSCRDGTGNRQGGWLDNKSCDAATGGRRARCTVRRIRWSRSEHRRANCGCGDSHAVPGCAQICMAEAMDPPPRLHRTPVPPPPPPPREGEGSAASTRRPEQSEHTILAVQQATDFVRGKLRRMHSTSQTHPNHEKGLSVTRKKRKVFPQTIDFSAAHSPLHSDGSLAPNPLLHPKSSLRQERRDPWTSDKIKEKLKIHFMAQLSMSGEVLQRFDSHDQSTAAQKSRQYLAARAGEQLARGGVTFETKYSSSTKSSCTRALSTRHLEQPPSSVEEYCKITNSCSPRALYKQEEHRMRTEFSTTKQTQRFDDEPLSSSTLEAAAKTAFSPSTSTSSRWRKESKFEPESLFDLEFVDDDVVRQTKLEFELRNRLATISASSCLQVLRIVPGSLEACIYIPNIFDHHCILKFTDDEVDGRDCLSVNDDRVANVQSIFRSTERAGAEERPSSSLPRPRVADTHSCIIAPDYERQRTTVFIPIRATALVAVLGVTVASSGHSRANGPPDLLAKRTETDSLLRQYLSNLGSAIHNCVCDTAPITQSPVAAKLFSMQKRVNQLTQELHARSSPSPKSGSTQGTRAAHLSRQTDAATVLQAHFRRRLSVHAVRQERFRQQQHRAVRKHAAAIRLQAHVRRRQSWNAIKGKHKVATTLQAHFRRRKSQQKVQQLRFQLAIHEEGKDVDNATVKHVHPWDPQTHDYLQHKGHHRKSLPRGRHSPRTSEASPSKKERTSDSTSSPPPREGEIKSMKRWKQELSAKERQLQMEKDMYLMKSLSLDSQMANTSMAFTVKNGVLSPAIAKQISPSSLRKVTKRLQSIERMLVGGQKGDSPRPPVTGSWTPVHPETSELLKQKEQRLAKRARLLKRKKKHIAEKELQIQLRERDIVFLRPFLRAVDQTTDTRSAKLALEIDSSMVPMYQVGAVPRRRAKRAQTLTGNEGKKKKCHSSPTAVVANISRKKKKPSAKSTVGKQKVCKSKKSLASSILDAMH